jgi:hypothetical protein
MENLKCVRGSPTATASVSVLTIIHSYFGEKITWLHNLASSRKEFDSYLDSNAFEELIQTCSRLLNQLHATQKIRAFGMLAIVPVISFIY